MYLVPKTIFIEICKNRAWKVILNQNPDVKSRNRAARLPEHNDPMTWSFKNIYKQVILQAFLSVARSMSDIRRTSQKFTKTGFHMKFYTLKSYLKSKSRYLKTVLSDQQTFLFIWLVLKFIFLKEMLPNHHEKSYSEKNVYKKDKILLKNLDILLQCCQIIKLYNPFGNFTLFWRQFSFKLSKIGLEKSFELHSVKSQHSVAKFLSMMMMMTNGTILQKSTKIIQEENLMKRSKNLFKMFRKLLDISWPCCQIVIRTQKDIANINKKGFQ